MPPKRGGSASRGAAPRPPQAGAKRSRGGPQVGAAMAEVQSHADSDEEEPEGEDLFDEENFRKDYDARNDEEGEEDDASIEDEAFLDNRSEVSDISDRGRLEVNALLERRHRVERELAQRQRGSGAAAAAAAAAGRAGGLYAIDDDDRRGGGGGRGEGNDDDDELEDVLRDGVGALGGAGSDVDDDAARSHNGMPNEDEYNNANGAGTSSMITSDDNFYDRAIDAGFDWLHPQGDLTEYLNQELPRRLVKRAFYDFLFNFTLDGARVYQQRVHAMTRENGESFEISYFHLGSVYESKLAVWLADLPEVMLAIFNEAATYLVLRKMYPQYKNVHPAIRVRIADLPVIDPIREFRQTHMNVLVRVEGVVIRRSAVYPQLQAVRYDCTRCSFIIGPIMQRGEKETKISQCPSCHGRGPFRINMAMTEYRNHQTLVLQEPPSKVPPGRLPRSLEVILTHDLIDRAKPGEEVEVHGMYKNSFDPVLNHKQGFPVFTTVLNANNIAKRSTEHGRFRLPDEEKERVMALAAHPNIKQKLINSVAPSIHGREDIKLGLLLSLLSGVPKDVGGNQSHKIRGDINVLLVGDPGTAKSQFLKFVEKTANRAVFTTGRGSTAVGLTAAVHKDPITGDYALEGGALVIADRGVCLIDEFDKMSEQDRTSIHEAMEQQTIAVARAGIVTTLQARATIIAAANPLGGRYDPSLSFDANVDLTTPILSRFDLLFVVRDEVSVEHDMNLAQFICSSHVKSHPKAHEEVKHRERALHQELVNQRQLLDEAATQQEAEEISATILRLRSELTSGAAVREDEDPNSSLPLPQALLKKYLAFAKAHCIPRITNIDEHTISRLYSELRQESRHGGVPITVRHMESILRLSEAHARLHLREYVLDEDVTSAVALFLRCFLQTQKYSMRNALQNKFRKYLESDTEPVHLLHHKLKMLVAQTRNFERQISGGVEPVTVWVECAELEDLVAQMSVSAEAVMKYYGSPPFLAEFVLERDAAGVPKRIGHTRILAMEGSNDNDASA